MSTARATKANRLTATTTVTIAAPLSRELELTADQLLQALFALPDAHRLSILDSGGGSTGTPREGWAGGRFLIAGFNPFEIVEARGETMCITHRGSQRTEVQPEAALDLLDERLRRFHQPQHSANSLHLPFGGGACIATFAYDYASRINLSRKTRPTSHGAPINDADEPDATLCFYDSLVVHDYARAKTYAATIGGARRLKETCEIVCEAANAIRLRNSRQSAARATDEKSSSDAFHFDFHSAASHSESHADASHVATSNFTRAAYIEAVWRIKEHIAAGDIYQANLTQQFTVPLTDIRFTPEHVFLRLRRDHPSAFSAFVRRASDACISISPERFMRVRRDANKRRVEAWPIKGTRSRGVTEEDDERLRRELLTSEKDRAENVMIVDLLRNDLGRVCEYGSIEVTQLCALEEHPTLFHLVSKVKGNLRGEVTAGDLMRAAFPCGSITGAPKIRAMQIIDETETARRKLSMGAIGYFSFDGTLDLSVAIRTMTVRDGAARFNVGGGIVADSEAEVEYEESLTKARALLTALDAEMISKP